MVHLDQLYNSNHNTPLSTVSSSSFMKQGYRLLTIFLLTEKLKYNPMCWNVCLLLSA
ncbi:BgTH12-00019 [Blumeria graminis f. sp. triticale]|uniref:Bgt-20988 n=3 Tax=Blumeria graminis TaxID=34373 RepID=A0A381LBE3_BLUGR|nr:BgTH12-00019 [Blumeria graminis f. sp. triticale]VDB92441.1 Bgt-20988 [Blumeria graminis f. sp. tritici]